MWQGANRIQADTVDIDREKKRTLVADGHVVTNLWEEPKDEEQEKARRRRCSPKSTPAHMVYTEADRLTHYTGGVQLNRARHAGEVAGTARLSGRSRRRFAPGEGLRRWRRGDLLHGKDRTRTAPANMPSITPTSRR